MKTKTENERICPICLRKGADESISEIDKITTFGINENNEYAHKECMIFVTQTQDLSLMQ